VSGLWRHAWASLGGRRLLIVRQPPVVVVGPDARRPYSVRPSLIYRRSDPEGRSCFLLSVPGADQWLLAFDARVLVPLLRIQWTCPNHRRTATCSISQPEIQRPSLPLPLDPTALGNPAEGVRKPVDQGLKAPLCFHSDRPLPVLRSVAGSLSSRIRVHRSLPGLPARQEKCDG
jgi:hypothetical protein